MQWPVAGGQWSAGSRSAAMPQTRRASLFTVHRPLTTDHDGFTLVELLVVIAIISAVTIATIPLLLPALDSRRIREAARMVSTHFASAQSEALATGRSVGVWIERLSSEPTAAMDLFLCEVPPPYAGDAISSTVTIKIDTNGVAYFVFNAVDATAVAPSFLRPGDQIRFGYRGAWYRLPGMTGQPSAGRTIASNQVQTLQNVTYLDPQNNTRTSPIGYEFEPVDGSNDDTSVSPPKPRYRYLPPAAVSATGWTTPFQIYRQPVKSASSPMQMPGGAVLDLAFSGLSTDTFQDELPTSPTNLQTAFPADKRPLIFTFGKTGALDSIYIMGQQYPLTDPIYFLIGKREKLPPQNYVNTDPIETQSDKHNFRDLENIWISINPKTGLVTTAEVAQVDDTSITAGTQAQMLSKAIPAARQFATSAQSMGGR
jgi:prepilin-type N-terminal cleavage/methylation domain-containing protein